MWVRRKGGSFRTELSAWPPLPKGALVPLLSVASSEMGRRLAGILFTAQYCCKGRWHNNCKHFWKTGYSRHARQHPYEPRKGEVKNDWSKLRTCTPRWLVASEDQGLLQVLYTHSFIEPSSSCCNNRRCCYCPIVWMRKTRHRGGKQSFHVTQLLSGSEGWARSWTQQFVVSSYAFNHETSHLSVAPEKWQAAV